MRLWGEQHGRGLDQAWELQSLTDEGGSRSQERRLRKSAGDAGRKVAENVSRWWMGSAGLNGVEKSGCMLDSTVWRTGPIRKVCWNDGSRGSMRARCGWHVEWKE